MIIHGCLKRCIFCIRIYLWKADAVKQSYKKILVVGISIEKGTEFSSVPSFIYGGKILNSITSSKEFILHNISITNTACLVNVMVVAYVEIFPMVKCPPDIQTAPEQPLFYLAFIRQKHFIWCIEENRLYSLPSGALVYSIMDVLATWRLKIELQWYKKCSLIINGILFFWARYFIITEHLAQQDDIGYTYRYLHMTNHLKPFCWSTLSHDSRIVAVLVANVSKNHSWIFFVRDFMELTLQRRIR